MQKLFKVRFWEVVKIKKNSKESRYTTYICICICMYTFRYDVLETSSDFNVTLLLIVIRSTLRMCDVLKRSNGMAK